jgi:hypothetical protein
MQSDFRGSRVKSESRVDSAEVNETECSRFAKPNSSAAWQRMRLASGDVSVDDILLEPDGRGSFTFTFSSARGELFGRVNVGTEGPPDRRLTTDKERAAKNQILALARELAQVCE